MANYIPEVMKRADARKKVRLQQRLNMRKAAEQKRL